MRLLLMATALACLLGARPACAAGKVDYLKEVKPLLAAHCYACHGALQQKAGLRLDTAKALRAGSDRGVVVVPGRAADSRILGHVAGSGGLGRMPPPGLGEALTTAQVATLRSWIEQGAQGPPDEKPEPDPREHWAFHTPVRPTIPVIKDPAQSANPIDSFLAPEWGKRGLVPQPPADRRLLLRRVYLDLIGLPPTLAEQEAFLADGSPDAYEKVVERLLARPQYGERWGRHWMDVWRYSDWWGLGAEVRNSQKHIWHWRDWIIESLNADEGYDQMVREMLAADELYPDDPGRLRATGYLARAYFLFNRNTWLDEVVEHTSKAFLGLTLNCAKCHDHKYDPVAQADYYRLRAFFEPYQLRTDEVPGQVDFEKDGIPRAFDCNLEAPTYRFVRGDEKRPLKDKPLAPGLPPLLALGKLDIRPVSLPAAAHAPGLRPFVLADHLRTAEQQIAAARRQLSRARQAVDRATARTLDDACTALTAAEKALAAAEAQPPALRARACADRAHWQQPPAADVHNLARQAARAERLAEAAKADEALARAELALLQAAPADRKAALEKRNAARQGLVQARKALQNPGETYTPLRGALKTLESNVEAEASRTKPFPATSTGRRSALAKWLTDPRHPLTARVAVNHVWSRHFGKPLVPTVFDFGRKGTPPTHPALLDFLAVELVEHGWSLKHLHRLMVTSDAYRRSSSAAGATSSEAADPENRWYWRRDPVRMEAQAVRDALLHLAGELDPTMGGPPIDPVAQEASRRRSLYFVHSHNDHHKFLSTFDDASVLECYRRSESIVPQQALALSNSRLSLDAAARIAARLRRQLGQVPDAAFVRGAFEFVLCATPTAQEQAECERALAEWSALLKQQGKPDPAGRARTDLIGALVNHNDFITVR
jgi:mono/diheme cytochrome c family protein